MALGQNQQNNMKGLQLFIADLRANQKTKEHARRIQTELQNIRTQFTQKSGLNGYQRKKYVAKMAYIYITTNAGMVPELLFGLDQCFQLLKSSNFSEKWIGYMTLELLFNHAVVRNSVLEKTISCLKLDLSSGDANAVSLALNFVGIVGNRDEIFADNLSETIFGILRSPVSSAILKRKACLAFLTLIRYKPQILTNLVDNKRTLWIERITTLLGDENDHGLLLSLLPLLEFIAREIDVNPCLRLIPQLAEILHECLSKKQNSANDADYQFSGVSNPWIVGNCVSLLQVLVSDNGENLIGSNIDQQTLGKLRVCVSHAVSFALASDANPVTKNAQYSVMFTMLGFACKLDPTNEAISNSVTGLCELMTSNDLNTRYSTFDLLIKICKVNGTTAIKTIQNEHLTRLVDMLKRESDVTLLRKIIDLLVILTDVSNFKFVVQELLSALEAHKSMDFALREDLSFQIERLIELHADDLNWFVLSSLRLLSSNTSIKNDHVWKRICQIVVNNEPLHKLACEHLIDYLHAPNVAESLVKAGVFLLAEYASLVNDKVSAGDLFNLFTEKYFQVSNLTKAMILTGMLKLYHVEPQLSSVVVKFFQLELNSFDVILQTRSYEYLTIIQYSKMNDMTFIDKLLPGMPPFASSKDTDIMSKLPKTQELLSLEQPFTSGNTVDSNNKPASLPTPPRSRKNNKLYHSQQLTPGWESGFKRMLIHTQGVFYQDTLVSVLFRVETKEEQPSTSKITFTYVNKSDWEITGLSCEIIPLRADNNPPYVLQVLQSPDSKLAPSNGRTSYTFEITTRFPFPQEHASLLSSQFKCGGQYCSHRLKIGYTILSTLSPRVSEIKLAQFVQRWKSIGDSLGKAGEHVDVVECQHTNLQKLMKTMSKVGFDVVQQSSIPNIAFAGGILHTKSDGNYGCLLKLRLLDSDDKVQITCKTTSSGDLSRFVINCIKKVVEE